ncbi:hypothetical protein CP8484711_1349B, partial [Chlamydia psittaci 84-8471/1]
PVSTKTQDKRSPKARCSKTAKTEESTPPERASNTRSVSPTFSCISLISCFPIF